MKLLYLLSIVALGWIPAAAADDPQTPDFSEYVRLHVTRGAAAPPPGSSCRGKLQADR